MRVGLDYRPALVNREGLGRYARELVRALVELGYDRHLALFGYTLAASKYSRAELGLAGSKAELLRLRLPSKSLPWLLARLGKGVDDLVGGPELYHHTQPNRLPVRRAVESAILFDCLYLDPLEFVAPREGLRMEATARALAAGARRVLVPSEFVGAELVLSLGVYPSKISVTHLGCEHLARLLPPVASAPARERFALSVARVDRRKNFVRTLRAVERLLREGLLERWILCGPAGYAHEEFAAALERSPARGQVQWRRSAGDLEVAQLMASASVFLFPSLGEGFGLPPLEAMACGAPVVTSALSSLPEVCGDAAELVDPFECDAIFEAARRVLSDEGWARELRARGLERARRFSWRNCAKATLAAWQQAIADTGSAQPLRRSL